MSECFQGFLRYLLFSRGHSWPNFPALKKTESCWASFLFPFMKLTGSAMKQWLMVTDCNHASAFSSLQSWQSLRGNLQLAFDMVSGRYLYEQWKLHRKPGTSLEGKVD